MKYSQTSRCMLYIIIMSKSLSKKTQFHFSNFYHFHPLQNLSELKSKIISLAERLNVIGLIILAEEGVNATVASTDISKLRTFTSELQELLQTSFDNIKDSSAYLSRSPFRRLKIKIRNEIVTLGVDGINPMTDAGTYVEPEEWNELISDPDVLLVDTRNVYEYRLGTFKGAVDPRTLNFRQFPEKLYNLIKERNPRKVAMFCTGGIRCEKASAVARQMGIEDVYHLKGGVLEYFERIPRADSAWEGSCFVFDGRITVTQELQAKPEPLCSHCGQVKSRNPDSGEYECYQCFEYPIAGSPQYMKSRDNS